MSTPYPLLTRTTALIIGASFIIGLALCTTIAARSFLTAKRMDEYVTVKGLSEKEVDADLVLWPVTFRVNAETLTDLQKEMEKGRGVVLSFLKTNGFEEKETSLSAPTITDTYEEMAEKANSDSESSDAAGKDKRPKLPRYNADVTVLLRTTKVLPSKKAMETCDILVQQGIALRYTRAQFNFTGLNAIKPGMIEEANKKAREAAQRFGSDSNSGIGRIKHATQGTFEVLDVDASAPERKLVRVVTTVDFYLD